MEKGRTGVGNTTGVTDRTQVMIARMCINYLTRRGYLVIRHEIGPFILLSHAVGTFKKQAQETEYKVHLPDGHKLWALNHTIIVEDKEK
jgi:hypothetical protein